MMFNEEYAKLWDTKYLQEEIKDLFGEFDPMRWSLDAQMEDRFKEWIADGKPASDFYVNEVGMVYQSFWNQATNDERNKYLAMLKWALENNARTALDLGCGVGMGPVTLAMGGLEKVYGIEVCEPCMAVLRSRRERLGLDNLVVVKATAKGRWDWRKLRVDLAICTEVLEHVEDPEALARELYEVINPGGAIICSWSFVDMPTHLPQHFYLQARHPDTLLTEGFGVIMQEIGFEFLRYSWFNNMIWTKPAETEAA